MIKGARAVWISTGKGRSGKWYYLYDTYNTRKEAKEVIKKENEKGKVKYKITKIKDGLIYAMMKIQYELYFDRIRPI